VQRSGGGKGRRGGGGSVISTTCSYSANFTVWLGEGPIDTFDDKVGLIWARLMAEGKAAGRPGSGLDMIVAAIASANDCMRVTGNEKDFAGIQFINTMRRPD